ncbi:MAG: SGNH/GDSL hydrolase family protein [Chitinophagaceae bacterium]|nr:SGNH/GDSL hydrolase family protein [Chitinophagaceae bacterium]
MRRFHFPVLPALSRILILICTCMVVNACQREAAPGDSARHILFVGNSLTYSNDLPGIVTTLAKAIGISVETTTLAEPNYAHEDHWNDGKMEALIASGKFDFVLVQQGLSSQEDGRVMLLDYGARIKALCEKQHAKLAFFMVWPVRANAHTFTGVINNYRHAAIATESLLCRVGEVWKQHYDRTGDFSFY